MNNNISKCLPFALLLLTLPHAGSAWADEDDAFSLVTSASWQYQDNVLYLPDGQRPPAVFGLNAPRGDQSYVASVGLNFNKRIGRQQLSASASQIMTRYNDLKTLDNDGHNVLASWKWELGNDLSGQLRYSNRRYMQGFNDFRSLTPVKNLVDLENLRFDATYKLDAFWALIGGVSRDSLRNGVPSRLGSDYDIDRYELGARYTTRGGTSFELVGIDTQGDYPNRLPTSNVTNSYSQKNLEARIRWQPVGHSRLSASIGQANRKHDNLPERDYEDVYGRVGWEWTPSGKFGVSFLAERQISALDDIVSSYFRTTTYSIAPMWQATGKLRFDGRVQWLSRDASGDSFFSTLSPAEQAFYRVFFGIDGTARQEDITTYSLGATWAIQRNLTANAELRHDSRDSNVQFYQYRVRSVSMSLQYLF
ncbi:XrtB/PEP-CTERM-associated polysaccharide biosynthesis outer membrane protein EpsL [Methyloversatilis sp.]|uniref:XrtB/PEP-CTERM-associated polysaccharide biosynthesis outer membrane protein EpsL n=1 Tax=Methyloversatilis sp. TaxID=2569862 RepID=UPI003D2DFEE7